MNYNNWKPTEQLFEEVDVMYSWNQVDGFTAFQYTLTYEPLGVHIPRTVYILGSRADFDTLLAHWNRREDDWICS